MPCVQEKQVPNSSETIPGPGPVGTGGTVKSPSKRAPYICSDQLPELSWALRLLLALEFPQTGMSPDEVIKTRSCIIIRLFFATAIVVQ